MSPARPSASMAARRCSDCVPLHQPPCPRAQLAKEARHGVGCLVGERDEGAAAVGIILDPLKQSGFGELADPAQRRGRRNARGDAQRGDLDPRMLGARGGEI